MNSTYLLRSRRSVIVQENYGRRSSFEYTFGLAWRTTGESRRTVNLMPGRDLHLNRTLPGLKDWVLASGMVVMLDQMLCNLMLGGAPKYMLTSAKLLVFRFCNILRKVEFLYNL